MWAALALTTAAMSLAPAQGGDLKLTNVRTTLGILGPELKGAKALPGDVLVIAYDIENVKVKDDGRVLYSMGMEVTRKGVAKPVFKQEPQDLVAVNRLGGTTVPSFAVVAVGTDQKKGDYTVKVTVKDRSTNKTATLTKDFEILEPALGLVRVRVTNSANEPAPPVGVPGQRLHLNCALVGFKTNKAKLPDVTFEMQVYDSNGKATLAKPYKGDIKKEVGGDMMTFMPIELDLNRAGKFKVTIKATDNNAKKTVEQSLDVNVIDK